MNLHPVVGAGGYMVGDHVCQMLYQWITSESSGKRTEEQVKHDSNRYG